MRPPTTYAIRLTLILFTVALCAAGQTAPPSTDIFLVDVLKRGGQLALGAPVNITFRPGYDNQPAFMPDGKSILFTSQREGAQTEIYRYDLAARFTSRLTNTAESEYSPTVTPDEKSFSVIRVETDKTQRLWQFPLAGGAPALVLPNSIQIGPVGYHVWLDANTLALFVLGQPNTLQLVDVKTEKAEVLAQSIGRALHRIPGQPSQFSFVHKVEKEWWVKAYDLKTRQTTNLIKTLPNSEDCAWLPNGTLLMAQGSKLFKWQRGKDADWQLVGDLAETGVTNITRLAVNAKGDKLALVAQPPVK
ncbi:MAG: PD40 domain-containing protein [Acidobacteria bacterium]|nr:PD40 domain-containing protein [Acidobacteriota bacterium]MBI3424878.1 PD40 domain-containing protein [Acidobacteriota bacterium]